MKPSKTLKPYVMSKTPKKTLKRKTSLKRTPFKKKASKKKVGKRRKSVTTLKNILWRIFSKWVRLHHSDYYGYCTCITCGKSMFWKEAQAGHFVSRRYNSTLYHPKNVHPQCAYDNMYLSGAQYQYSKRLDEIYGEGTAEEIYLLSKQDKKFLPEELEELIDFYKGEVEKLSKEKGISD